MRYFHKFKTIQRYKDTNSCIFVSYLVSINLKQTISGETVDFGRKLNLTVSLTFTLMLLLITTCLILKHNLFGTFSNILVSQMLIFFFKKK